MIKGAKTETERAVSALHSFLELVRDSPRKFTSDKELLFALRRQDRLATYRNLEHHVVATSRSTIDRVCNRLLEGGTKAFDNLRKEALEELKTVGRLLDEMPAPPKRTRDHYKQKAKSKSEEVTLGLVDCWHLTSALYAAIQAGRAISADSKNAAIMEKWRKLEAVILCEVRLSKKLVVTKGGDAERWAESIRVI
ncbi:hypothetical protein [Caballeronia sp. LZ019]|uniref:hypothetical protein n=1 Tax=Caballeronia sp. LZ019 TaxID=3038555 RepID=UPI00285E99C5|nr:hypothetical protein [Caballeronia sp. LZ019]MDR5810667.1 hypothetical protein [Caballeronia sp. LZ019]